MHRQENGRERHGTPWRVHAKHAQGHARMHAPAQDRLDNGGTTPYCNALSARVTTTKNPCRAVSSTEEALGRAPWRKPWRVHARACTKLAQTQATAKDNAFLGRTKPNYNGPWARVFGNS